MERSKHCVFAVVLALTVIAVAENGDYKPDPGWKAPAQAAAKANPLGKSAAAAQKGRGIYEARCSMCHNSDGSGIANAANLRLPLVQRESDGTLFWKISTGHQAKGMPSFGFLPEDQRWQLVSYIRSFRRGVRR